MKFRQKEGFDRPYIHMVTVVLFLKFSSFFSSTDPKMTSELQNELILEHVVYSAVPKGFEWPSSFVPRQKIASQ